MACIGTGLGELDAKILSAELTVNLTRETQPLLGYIRAKQR